MCVRFTVLFMTDNNEHEKKITKNTEKRQRERK